MLVNCFNPNNNKSDNGWGTSSSKMLYLWCTQEIQSMIYVWNGNNIFLPEDILPDKIINEFGLQLSKTICEEVDNPIIWKTTPSRKHSNLGHFMTVNISKPQLPPLGSTLSTVSTFEPQNITAITIYSSPPKKRDDFFSKLVNDFDSIDHTASFQMNLRSFLLHVIIFKIHGNHSHENYEKKAMRVMMENGIFKSLDYGKWFRNSSAFGDFCKNSKKKIQKFNPGQKSYLELKCGDYIIHQDDYEIPENQRQDISILTAYCFKGANANIIELITQKHNEYLVNLE